MKKFNFLLYCFILCFCAQAKNFSLSFTENKGQVCDQYHSARPDVIYSGNINGITFHLKNNGISYQLHRTDNWEERVRPRSTEKIKTPAQSTIYRLDIGWPGINPSFTTDQDNVIEGHSNYYLPSCPDGVHNVRSFTGITYKNLYKNIDLHYYEKNGQLKYDYLVQPNTDYKQIRLQIAGAEKILLQPDGSLLLKTPLGDIKEDAPIVYQGRSRLKAKWIVENNTLSFEIENYNPGILLVIDPAVRLWGTYYGDTEPQNNTCTATDLLGNVYMGGYGGNLFNTYLATTGAHQTIGNGGSDGFLVKFNGSGSRLWATYYGGASHDYLSACTVDASGNVFASGETASNDGTTIASANAHQSSFGGGSDAFLVKFDSSGVRQWATYYGDNGFESGVRCAADKTGNIYLAGYTSQSTATVSVISTSGAHQPTFSGGVDAFLVKFSASGTRIWGTYYGGSGSEFLGDCATDASGNVYLSGFTNTNSGTTIATTGSQQSNYLGGSNDGFLVKFNSGGVRQWGTYYGGSDDDKIWSCTTDPSGNVFIAGETKSYGFIASSGSHQSTIAGANDAFLAKFNGGGVRLWSTYYGGAFFDVGNACTCDPAGNVYLAGSTTSQDNNAISTLNSQQVTNPGYWCAFLAKFNSAGVRQFGTFYGGLNDTYAYGCSADVSGIYLSGNTTASNPDLISTPNAFQTLGMGNDAFLSKFKDGVPTSALQSEPYQDNFASAFPNPTDGKLEINAESYLDKGILELFNSSGDLIFKKNLAPETPVDLTGLPTGIYLIKLSDANKHKILKVIKE